MKKMKRILALLLSVTIFLSTDEIALYASSLPNESEVTEEGTEITREETEASEDDAEASEESTEVAENGIEASETVEMDVPVRLSVTADEEIYEWTGGYRALPEEYDVEAVDEELALMLLSGELEEKYTTPNLPVIRNQNPYGTCWAFSSIALGELDLLKSGKTEVDLSELHLAYFTYNSVVDPLGGTAGDKNSLASDEQYNFLNIGGNLVFSMQTLAGWMGLTDEEKVPYTEASTVASDGLGEEYAYADTVHLKNAYCISIKKNPEIVKAMIKEYGGVSVSYYAESYPEQYYSEEYNSYYVPDFPYTNHAVTVVGWDDTFPKEHFTTEAPGDGAWLIRNSWGSYNDEQNVYGYFWLSYYDSSLLDASYAFDVTMEGEDDYYDNNYQYDGGLLTASMSLQGSIKGANVFTAHANDTGEFLRAVSFSTKANQSYQIEVYKNLASPAIPDSGTLVAEETGVCPYEGIYTIELDEGIALEEGETFSVVLTLYAVNKNTSASINCEYPGTVNGWYDSKVSAKSGQSFLCYGSNYWEDFGETRNCNLRIKAYTDNHIVNVSGVSVSESSIELGIGEEKSLTASIIPVNAFNKNVTWKSADENIATVDASGRVTGAGYGDTVVTVTTEDGGFTADVAVKVSKKLVGISLDKETEVLSIGDTVTLQVSYNPSDTISDKKVTWGSSDPEVIKIPEADAGTSDNDNTINDKITLTAQKAGRAVITATVGGKTASCVVSVKPSQTTVTAASEQDGSVTIKWNAVADCTHYNIYRRAKESEKAEYLTKVSAGTTSYKDTTAADGKRYYYSVGAAYDDELGEEVSTVSKETYVVYRVIYELAGGTNAKENPTAYCEKDGIVTLIDPELENANFLGWYLDPEYEHPVTAINPSEHAGNLTLYAKWHIRQEIQSDWISDIAVQSYTGNVIEPDLVIAYDGKMLVQDKDYIVSYENNVNTGTATVIVTGIGDYRGTVRKNFTIITTGLKTDFLSAIPNQIYTGGEIRPEIVLNYAGSLLKENRDYRVSFSDNIEMGQATVTIKGTGNYRGTITAHFQIVGMDLTALINEGDAGVSVEGSDETYSVVYTGDEITPEVTILLADGTELTAGKDYAVSYRDNIMPGTAVIVILGKGNYSGEFEKTFEIRKCAIGQAVVTAGRNLTVLYTPAGQTPVPHSEYNGMRLENGVDYTPVYYQLDAVGQRTGEALDKVTDAGTYEVVLRGNGIFSGQMEHAATVTVKARTLKADNVIIENPYARIDGDKITAKYRLIFGGCVLTEGTDYIVTYSMGTNRQYVLYRFEGIGNYSGTLTKKFIPVAEDAVLFSEGNYKIAPIANQTYTGERICPSVSVVKTDDELVRLSEGVDYAVLYSHNLNTGTATVTVTGMGSYIGTMKESFEIVPSDTVTVEMDTQFVYNADVQKPVVQVRTETGLLKEGTDYDVVYTDMSGNAAESRNAGTYQATVTLKGNYTGVHQKSYEIKPLTVDKLQIVMQKMSYTGVEIVPTVEEMTVSINGRVLTEEEKAGLTMTQARDNVEVSDSAVAVLTGSGNFAGETEVIFAIGRKPVSDRDLTLYIAGDKVTSNQTGYRAEWTGQAIEPVIEIYNGSTILKANEDYTLAYRYNTDVGTARVIIYGKGNYQGSRTLYYAIKGIEFSEEKGFAVSITEDSPVYTGRKHEPDVAVTKDGIALTRDRDYSVTYVNNINAGTAQVVVAGMGCYEGSITKSFTITPKTITDAATVKISAIAKQRYTREAIEPELTIQLDGIKLQKGKDYVVTLQNNVEVGTATITATGAGNYSGKLTEQQFEIYITKITYVMNGGVNSPNNPTTYTASDSFTLADPQERDAYLFAGWYSDKACTKRVTKVKAGTNGNLTFYAKWTAKQVYGIDVSKWQGNIDWNSVKRSGKVFAIMRISYGTTLDPYFEDNYSGAKNAGIKVGVYCYNTARTVDAAVKEAQDVISKLKGRQLDYPVCLDVEGKESEGLSNELRTDIVYAFKKVIEANGYEFMLYSNTDWLNHKYVSSRLAPLDLWVARYCDFNLGHRYTGPGNVRIWQYTSSGSVSGINGRVDLDICYKDYVKK